VQPLVQPGERVCIANRGHLRRHPAHSWLNKVRIQCIAERNGEKF